MAKAVYVPEDMGVEVVAPAGYFTPLEERFLDHGRGLLLYVTGRTCIETSCCGAGDWEYVRVEGHVDRADLSRHEEHKQKLEIDTIDSEDEKKEITRLLVESYPNARIEFR